MANRYKILCVDDEEAILKSLERTLRMKGYTICTASGGEEGLSLLEKEDVDLIIADQRMPGMCGSEFLRIAREKHPETIRIMLSGYSDFTSLTKAVNEGEIFRFISKPWDMDDLFSTIQAALEKKRVISIVEGVIRDVCEMTTLAENIKIESDEDQRTVTIRVEKDELLSDDTVSKFMGLLLDSISEKSSNEMKVTSGSILKDHGKIVLTVDIGQGVMLKIVLPRIG